MVAGRQLPRWMRRWEQYVGWNSFDWSTPVPPVFKEPPGPITNREILEVRRTLTWVAFRTFPMISDRYKVEHARFLWETVGGP